MKQRDRVRRCVVCRCTDERGCVMGCEWERVKYCQKPVCSVCAPILAPLIRCARPTKGIASSSRSLPIAIGIAKKIRRGLERSHLLEIAW